MRVRFTIDSDWRRLSVLIYSAKYKLKYSLHLDCFETKRYVMYLFNIQYNIIIIDCTKVNVGNCHPSKTNFNLGFASVDIGFLGVTISYVSFSCSQ